MIIKKHFTLTLLKVQKSLIRLAVPTKKKRETLDNVSLYLITIKKNFTTTLPKVRNSQVRPAIPTKKKRETLENISLYLITKKKPSPSIY